MFKLLHIEASELIKKMVSDKIEKVEKDIQYITVSTADEAYKVIMSDKFDLIVTTLFVKGDTFENLVTFINESSLNKASPVFILSSTEIDNEKKVVMDLGISDYILKDELTDEVAKHIECVERNKITNEYLETANIAVVDDSRLDLAVMKNIFKEKKLSNNIDYYLSSKDLFDSRKKYDIYFIDAVLKNEYGMSLILKIRRNNIDASIFVISSLTNPKTIGSLLNAGADDYINKPVQSELLISKILASIKNQAQLKKLRALNKEV